MEIAPVTLKTDLQQQPAEVAGQSLTLSAEGDYVVSKWEGFVSKKILINGAVNAIQFLAGSKCSYLLVDQRGIHGTWADILDWQESIWLPLALNAGLKKYAIVAHPGSYAVMAAELLYARLHTQLEMMIFSDIEEAQKWFRSNS